MFFFSLNSFNFWNLFFAAKFSKIFLISDFISQRFSKPHFSKTYNSTLSCVKSQVQHAQLQQSITQNYFYASKVQWCCQIRFIRMTISINSLQCLVRLQRPGELSETLYTYDYNNQFPRGAIGDALHVRT